MRKNLVFLLLCLPLLAKAVSLKDINVRDPFILADAESHTYYLYCSSSVERDGQKVGGVAVYQSRDLLDWQGPEQVFVVPSDNWLTGRVWAPEVHYYEGKYYLFATLNTDMEWKKRREGWQPYLYRGTQIFHADSPMGPFLPFGTTPHTPADRMCLDGTLYVEDGTPYMVYCHEWVQTVDGEMQLQRLSPDLSEPVGQPLTLFCASAAPWSNGLTINDKGEIAYVTDGCFLYKTSKGKLLMLWSSFLDNSYAIGIATSATGRISGPWRQQSEPLFANDGGHCMLFRTFGGQLCLVFHSPNSPSGAERACLYEVTDNGETLVLGRQMQ